MVKILVQILSQVIGNSETLYPPLKRQYFPHPQNDAGTMLLPESQQIRLTSLEWGVQVQGKSMTLETCWLPARVPPRTVGSDLDSTIARKSQATQGKTIRLYEKSKVYCKLYFASLRSSFLQDLLISMIFSQMYLLTLESLCAISVSSTVSCAILSYKHSRQGKETRRPRINGGLEYNLLRGQKENGPPDIPPKHQFSCLAQLYFKIFITNVLRKE